MKDIKITFTNISYIIYFLKRYLIKRQKVPNVGNKKEFKKYYIENLASIRNCCVNRRKNLSCVISVELKCDFGYEKNLHT